MSEVIIPTAAKPIPSMTCLAFRMIPLLLSRFDLVLCILYKLSPILFGKNSGL